MPLQDALTATRVIETLENYVESDLVNEPATSMYTDAPTRDWCWSAEDFWAEIFHDVAGAWGREYRLRDLTLSEQVARVPGLYFHPAAQVFKQMAAAKEEYISGKWTHYSPAGKSQIIMSGIGTLQVPPDLEGWRIATVGWSNNSSVGIPVLIHEEVWQHHNLTEGRRISMLTGRWRQMDRTWAGRFQSMRGIPKGYLVIRHPDQLRASDQIAPTIYHPFTIMEYERNGGLFYDFVYVTVDSSEPNFRQAIGAFLGEYRYLGGRFGTYLIEPFINEPVISHHDILYQSPAELREAKSGADSHLKLLIERIKKERFNQHTIDDIKIFMDQHLGIDELKVCSDDILIPVNAWFKGKSVYDESANLLDQCVQRGKVEELVDALTAHGLQPN